MCIVNEEDDDGPGYDLPGKCRIPDTGTYPMLKDYDIVIWFTGNDYGGTGEETLRTFE
jgi:multimeric flavodoxin WrbA